MKNFYINLVISKLRERDEEVKQHEMAHLSAGGQYVKGGPSYKYVKGPDGKMYAVGGEVEIDTSPEKDPEKTIKKMEQIKRAALAPRNPSAQDKMVAEKAAIEEMKARMELWNKKYSINSVNIYI